MSIPQFTESNHSLIKALANCSDLELLSKFQDYPEQGKYFTAIFCRYGQIVHSVIGKAKLSPLESDYLFALTWRDFFYELRGLALNIAQESPLNSLQNWLIYNTGFCIKEKKLPPVEKINYNLQLVPPPLWCYLGSALDNLPPLLRFILVACDNFRWSHTRLITYLQAEGETISQQDIKIYLNRAYEMIESILPEDIRLIYLNSSLNHKYFDDLL